MLTGLKQKDVIFVTLAILKTLVWTLNSVLNNFELDIRHVGYVRIAIFVTRFNSKTV